MPPQTTSQLRCPAHPLLLTLLAHSFSTLLEMQIYLFMIVSLSLGSLDLDQLLTLTTTLSQPSACYPGLVLTLCFGLDFHWEPFDPVQFTYNNSDQPLHTSYMWWGVLLCRKWMSTEMFGITLWLPLLITMRQILLLPMQERVQWQQSQGSRGLKSERLFYVKPTLRRTTLACLNLGCSGAQEKQGRNKEC